MGKKKRARQTRCAKKSGGIIVVVVIIIIVVVGIQRAQVLHAGGSRKEKKHAKSSVWGKRKELDKQRAPRSFQGAYARHIFYKDAPFQGLRLS